MRHRPGGQKCLDECIYYSHSDMRRLAAPLGYTFTYPLGAAYPAITYSPSPRDGGRSCPQQQQAVMHVTATAMQTTAMISQRNQNLSKKLGFGCLIMIVLPGGRPAAVPALVPLWDQEDLVLLSPQATPPMLGW
eukprot:GHVU01224011.1.p3 GENE.GHVU01224011.1~~GHVU01224011.1.p3  ORF type:complete len:134 (+),score=10.33 GHVU01224011.1:2253-2654(+)